MKAMFVNNGLSTEPPIKKFILLCLTSSMEDFIHFTTKYTIALFFTLLIADLVLH